MQDKNYTRTILVATAFALTLAVVLLWHDALPVNAAPKSTITVTTLVDEDVDNGYCSLREAIKAANTNTIHNGCVTGAAGMDTVDFSVSGIISLTSILPAVAEDLTIIGPVSGITIDGGGTVQTGPDVNTNITLNLIRLTISNGKTSGGGGAVINSGNLNISNTVFANNSADTSAGAIYSTGPLTITNSTFSGNVVTGTLADNNGGALYLSGGKAVISNTAFLSNTAGFRGGAIYVYNGAALTMTNSIFYSNSTPVDCCSHGGGAINFASISNSIITNTTFVSNTSSPGSAFLLEAGYTETITLTNSTIARNGGNSAITQNGGTVVLRNSIVAANGTSNCSGTVVDGGFNLQYGGSSVSCPGTIPVADPRLSPLANYGGLTKTFALFLGSPAIDAVTGNVNCPADDQRGVARPQGAFCDIGAFEGTEYPLFLPLVIK